MISKLDNNNQSTLNFKLGYDNNNNFIIGNSNLNDNQWYTQFSINNNAPTNSLLIDNNGNIGINTNNTNNFKIIFDSKLVYY